MITNKSLTRMEIVALLLIANKAKGPDFHSVLEKSNYDNNFIYTFFLDRTISNIEIIFAFSKFSYKNHSN